MGSITQASTAEYFAKNLQQVGFSSLTKAVLTTLKEAVDNALDACEEAGILPEVWVKLEKLGPGGSKGSEALKIVVRDNGPGIPPEELPKVFGEYLSSSKFGRGRCTRGQQGIGISAATTWAQLTQAQGVWVISKTSSMRKAVKALIEVDIRQNRGVMKAKETISWDQNSGTEVTFVMDGRLQLHGDGGILTYLEGTLLVNPHLSLVYELPGMEPVRVERASQAVPTIPEATLPHPHTFKLGEFLTYARAMGRVSGEKFLKTGFSRVGESVFHELSQRGFSPSDWSRPMTQWSEARLTELYRALMELPLMAPSTKSVLVVGEEALAQSIRRLGEVDFFSVVTRKPTICDHKPVVVEVALARWREPSGEDQENPVQLLRFANRVPLQFDKAGCAITKAIESVNWKNYGLTQPKGGLPLGPYIFAVSVTSPFIKFKNASKETIDASDELVEEIRRALMQAGQKLSKHIKKEIREADFERKRAHIEQFVPILVKTLSRICGASRERQLRAEEGLRRILGRDEDKASQELREAEVALQELKKREDGKVSPA